MKSNNEIMKHIKGIVKVIAHVRKIIVETLAHVFVRMVNV